MSELDDALTLQRDEGCWKAFADPGYESVNAMFGGWTTAVALRAVILSDDGEANPSAVTMNFIGPIEPGTDVCIRTRRLGGTRSVHHWLAELLQGEGDEVLALATVVLATRRQTDACTQPAMPVAPDPESLEEFHAPGPQGERSLIRPIHGNPPFGRTDTTSAAWVREMSGRTVDR